MRFQRNTQASKKDFQAVETEDAADADVVVFIEGKGFDVVRSP